MKELFSMVLAQKVYFCKYQLVNYPYNQGIYLAINIFKDYTFTNFINFDNLRS